MMHILLRTWGLAFVAVGVLGITSAHAASSDGFAQSATWDAPTLDKARTATIAYLTQQQASADVLAQAETIWTAPDANIYAGDLLDRLAQSVSLVEPQARELTALCSRARRSASLPKFEWLADEKTEPLVRDNLRLYLGRWLVQNRLYDEAFEQIETLRPEQVVDPAGLLFYQAVVHHQMLHKEPGLEAIARLLERQEQLPRRYQSIAKLMQADLTPLKDDSLDHIARRMDDITRRLDLGRAGQKTRDVEDGVIESLDKLIEEMEKAAAAAEAAAAAGNIADNIRSSSPAQDSVPMGGKAPGNVTQKNIGNKTGWGDLPPKDRQEALQQIGKDFPAHYRDVIEQYFRKLASEEREK
jgi:hypothetical protein